MEEMLEDTLDMVEDDEIEEEADAEVDKILFELTNGKLGEAATVTDLPVRHVFISPRLGSCCPGYGTKRRGRGNESEYGKVPSAAERTSERLKSLFLGRLDDVGSAWPLRSDHISGCTGCESIFVERRTRHSALSNGRCMRVVNSAPSKHRSSRL